MTSEHHCKHVCHLIEFSSSPNMIRLELTYDFFLTQTILSCSFAGWGNKASENVPGICIVLANISSFTSLSNIISCKVCKSSPGVFYVLNPTWSMSVTNLLSNCKWVITYAFMGSLYAHPGKTNLGISVCDAVLTASTNDKVSPPWDLLDQVIGSPNPHRPIFSNVNWQA